MPYVLNLIAILFLTASLRIWIEIVRRWRAGAPILAWEPRELVPWGPLEIVLAVGIFLLATQAFQGALPNPEPEPKAPPADAEKLVAAVQESGASAPPAQLDAAPELPDVVGAQKKTARGGIPQLLRLIAIQVVTGLACLAFLRVGTRATVHDLGISPANLMHDVRNGVLAYVAVAPPTFLLQLLLVNWFPSHHPIVDIVGDHPGIGVFLCTTLLAVVVAPLGEEFFFRVLLQGWLETADARMHARLDDAWPLAPARWPVVVSSVIFALMHASHGPDPIPLFLLALALGYLYRQTHRIWPSFVMHACFNATSMAMLGINLLEAGGGS